MTYLIIYLIALFLVLLFNYGAHKSANDNSRESLATARSLAVAAVKGRKLERSSATTESAISKT